MLPMDYSRMREEKVAQLRDGKNAFAETEELARLLRRSIENEQLRVEYDKTDLGCWFIPIKDA